MMKFLFTQEEVDEIERYNAVREGREEGLQEGRQEGRQEGQKELNALYAALKEKLSSLGRFGEFVEAIGDLDKLNTLAKEFGLEY